MGNVAPEYTDFWFYGCNNITEMDLTNLDTSGVTSMGHMFYGCKGLNGTFGKNGTAIKVGDKFTTANVTDMDYMFSDCSGLTNIDVSFFDTAKVTTTCAMFKDLNVSGTFGKNGTAIKIGDKFSTSSVTDMTYMFTSCYGLTSIDVSSFDTGNLKKAEAMFYYCKGLSGTFGKNGTAIKIGDKFTTANVTNMGYMFSGCPGLTVIDLTSFDTSHVTDMSSMFSECSGLSEVNLSSFNTANVVKISSFLSGCPSLVSVDLSDFDLSSATSVGDFFKNCNALATIKTPKTLSSEKLWLPTTYRNAKGESGEDIDYLIEGDGNENITIYRHAYCSGGTATCTRKAVCSVCGKEYGSLKAHTYGDPVQTKTPTCTEKGTQKHTCTECGYEGIEEIPIDENAHEWNSGEITTAPTCTEDGVKTYTCNHNPAHSKTETVNKLNHNYSEEFTTDKQATCTEKGSKSRHCTRCEEKTEVTEISALGHTEVIDQAVAATCTEKGKTEGKHCSACNEILITQNDTPALGHTEVIDQAVAATCTEKGKTEGKHCRVCNEILIAQTDTAALGHDKVHHAEKAATCTEIGWNAYDTCNRCDYTTYEEKAALGHDFETDFSVDKEPTVTEKGSKSKHCSRCGEKAEVTEIPMLEKKLVNPGATDGENDVVVEKEDGFDRGTKLVVETITDGYSKYSDVPGLSAEEVKLAYNVALVKGELTVEPDGMITIYLRIPSSAGKEFTLFALRGDAVTETEYTIDGDYAVITTDKLAEYVFVTNDDTAAKNAFNPLWLILIIGIIIAIVAIFVVIIYKKRKSNK